MHNHGKLAWRLNFLGHGHGFPKSKGTFLGVPIIRTIVYLGL